MLPETEWVVCGANASGYVMHRETYRVKHAESGQVQQKTRSGEYELQCDNGSMVNIGEKELILRTLRPNETGDHVMCMKYPRERFTASDLWWLSMDRQLFMLESHPVHDKYVFMPGWRYARVDQVTMARMYLAHDTGMLYDTKKKCLMGERSESVYIIDDNGKGRTMPLTHVLLYTFFPWLARKGRDADHIDNNHRNNNVRNLQWLTKRGNWRKMYEARREANVIPRIPVVHCSDNTVIRVFDDMQSAAEALSLTIEQVRSMLKKPELMDDGTYIRVRRLEEVQWPGERFQTSNALDIALRQTNRAEEKKLLASNQGRVWVPSSGRVFQGDIRRRHGSSKLVRFFSFQSIHTLVFMAFNNRRPFRIKHKQSPEVFAADGTYRNFLEDLVEQPRKSNEHTAAGRTIMLSDDEDLPTEDTSNMSPLERANRAMARYLQPAPVIGKQRKTLTRSRPLIPGGRTISITADDSDEDDPRGLIASVRAIRANYLPTC